VTASDPKKAAAAPVQRKPALKAASSKRLATGLTKPKARSETMEVEKITTDMQEPLPTDDDAILALKVAAPGSPRDAAAVGQASDEPDDEPEAPAVLEGPSADGDAPQSVAPRAEVVRDQGRGSPMGHGGRMQMSGPAPRVPSKAEIFVEGDYVVYPTHGVGKVEKINVEDIAGHRLELIHITFEENRMTLRVPVAKARSAGLRKLATRQMFDEALAILKGRARIKRTMWSRRAQEYEAKINSGDPLAIAEVVRDLHRNAGQPDQSFSERQIYEAAMDRLGAELAALDRTDKATAATKLAEFLKTI
jgi:CarD family transcriptional regulator